MHKASMGLAVVPQTKNHTKPGIVAASLFVMLIAGANVPNPLMPIYVEYFTLAPLAQAAILVRISLRW